MSIEMSVCVLHDFRFYAARFMNNFTRLLKEKKRERRVRVLNLNLHPICCVLDTDKI